MKHLILSFFFLLLIMGSHITSGQDLYIKNVNLLQVEKGYFEPNMYVLLKEGKIAAIENSEISIESNIRIVDGEGRYLIPGLFDMHAHFGQPSWVPMYLHYGVTSIRVMAGNDQLLNLQDSLENTGKPQPTLYIVSPLIDGAPPLWGDQHTEATIMHDTDIRPILERYMSRGYKEFKIYNRIPEAKYLEILAFAQEYGVRISGHLPYTLSISNFGDKRHHSIEHLDGFVQLSAMSGTMEWDKSEGEEKNRRVLYGEFDLYEIKDPIERLKSNQIWICPTLSLYANMGDENIKNTIFQSYYKDQLGGLFNFWKAMESNSADFSIKAKVHNEIIHEYFLDYSERILAGTDTPNPYNPPGLALHFELYHLSQAGFSNGEVLKIATLNAARYLGIEENFGTIDIGKIADLLILSNNPLEDIRSTKSIEMVIKNGVFFIDKETNN